MQREEFYKAVRSRLVDAGTHAQALLRKHAEGPWFDSICQVAHGEEAWDRAIAIVCDQIQRQEAVWAADDAACQLQCSMARFRVVATRHEDVVFDWPGTSAPAAPTKPGAVSAADQVYTWVEHALSDLLTCGTMKDDHRLPEFMREFAETISNGDLRVHMRDRVMECLRSPRAARDWFARSESMPQWFRTIARLLGRRRLFALTSIPGDSSGAS